MSGLSDNDTSSPGSQHNLMLESWGLPETILKQYKKRGVVSMFQWQFDCLTREGVLTGSNLVFSAPTSAGKTMVAEMIAIQTVLERKKKVLIILPFISVVREKMVYLQDLFKGTGVRVEGFMGSHAPPGGFKAVQIAIATIEKANSLINRLLEEGCLSEIGCVVVDELHLIGDPHRGYLLELLLTKLKYMRTNDKDCKVQVIGMSATLPNLSLLAKWLSAVLYKTDFRPIPLVEYLKVESDVIRTDNFLVERKVNPPVVIKNDPGDVIWLCLETILSGHSVLIFCPTKNWCETLAAQISSEIMRIGHGSTEISVNLREKLSRDAIVEMLEQLKVCPAGLDKILEKCVCFGVSYHHAGLTLEERNIIEGNFRNGTLKVLVATSTLSSGVNLPARRVIIRSPSFRSQPIDVLAYKQMVGRAGRMGVDSQGESILICSKAERNIGVKLVKSSLPPVVSCLGRSDISNSLKRAILEVIASGVVCNTADAERYASCTLLAASLENGMKTENSSPITSCLAYLEDNEFIKSVNETLTPTLLANACLSASLPPDQGTKLLKELHRARQCFVLDTELHVIYQVTPFSVSEQWGSQLDWLHILSLWENLTSSMRKVGELVGVDERFLVRAVRGTINYKSLAHMEKIVILRRFYTALALQDLVNEVPLSQVASKYQTTKGMIQSLQQSASAFAGLVTQFCRRLGWSTVELLVSQFCDRLQFGVHRELIDLLRCPSLDAARARALFNAGIETLTDLAGSEEDRVEKALRKAVPFESEKEECSKTECRRIWVAGRSGLTEGEAAVLVISEAREILKHELGLKKVEWSSEETANTLEPSSSSNLPEESSASSEQSIKLALSMNTTENIIINETAAISLQEKSVILNTSNSSSEMMKSDEMKLFINSSQDNCDMQDLDHESSNQEELKENKFVNINSSYDIGMKPAQSAVKPSKKSSSISNQISSNKVLVASKFEAAESIQESCFKSSSSHGNQILVNSKHEAKESVPKASDKSSILNPKQIFVSSKPDVDCAHLNLMCDNDCNRRESYDMFDCMLVDDSVFNMISTNDMRLDATQKATKSLYVSPVPALETSACSENKLDSLNSSSVVEASFTSEKKIMSLDSPSFLETSVNYEEKFNFSNSPKLSETFSKAKKLRKLNSPSVKECLTVTEKADKIDSPSLLGTLLISDEKLNSLIPQKRSKAINRSISMGDGSNSNRSSLDMFSNVHNSEKKTCLSALKRCESFEIFNSDSGGDSILESSLLIYEETLKELQSNTSVSNKRKRKSSNSRLVKQKLGTNSSKLLRSVSSPIAAKISSPDLFDDSFSSRVSSLNVSLESNGSVVSRKSVSPENSLFAQTLNMDTQLCKQLDGSMCKEKSSEKKSTKKSKPIYEPQSKIPVSQKFRRQTRLSQRLVTKLTQTKVNNKTANQDGFLDDVFLSDTQEFSLIKNHPKKLRRSSRNSSFQKPTSVSILPLSNAKKIGAKTRSSTRKSRSSENGEEVIGNSQEVCSSKSSRGSRFSFSKKTGPSTQKLSAKKVIQKDNVTIYQLCKNNKINRSYLERLLNHKSNLCLCMKYVKSAVKESSIGLKFIKKNSKSNLSSSSGKTVGKYDGASLIFTFTADAEDIYHLDLNTNDECGIEVMKEIFSCPDCTIVTVNTKYVYKIVSRFFNLKWICRSIDVAVAHWLLEPHSTDFSFEYLVKHYLLEKPLNNTFEDVKMIHLLYKILKKKLVEKDLHHVFTDVEMPCQILLAQLEIAGISFNRAVANEISANAEAEMTSVKEKIFELAGRNFNLNSPKDWKQVKKSLKISELEAGETHPVIDLVSQWRKISSLLSKSLNPLLLASTSSSKIHGSCYTHTITGRITMLEPNLQNIPRDFSVGSYTFSLRSAFIPAKGNMFISADFRQLELRVLAHLSRDELLKDSLLTGDVFVNIASKWNHIPAVEVTDTMRHQTKQLCYGLIYGMGINTLSSELGVCVETATEMSEEFKKAYPAVKQYIELVVEQCRQTKHILTLAGRYRYLPNINHSNPGVRSQAERQAVNSTIQGSAADIAKAAMIKVDAKLNQFKDDKNNITAHLVIQMHDELIFEVSDQYVFEVAQIVESAMTSAINLKVPLPVKVRIGDSWGSLQEMKSRSQLQVQEFT